MTQKIPNYRKNRKSPHLVNIGINKLLVPIILKLLNPHDDKKNKWKITLLARMHLYMSQIRGFPYMIEIKNRKFIVYRGVYSPYYFEDTEVFTKLLMKYIKKGQNFLEIGSGAGITSVFAALKGTKVTATDINHQAVKNTKKNADINKVKLNTKISNIFSNIERSEKFDIIYWNAPHLSGMNPLLKIDYSISGGKFEHFETFLEECKWHLKTRGKVFITSFSWEEAVSFELLKKIIKNKGYIISDKEVGGNNPYEKLYLIKLTLHKRGHK